MEGKHWRNERGRRDATIGEGFAWWIGGGAGGRGRAEEAERENSGLLTGASNSKGSRRLAVRQDADRDGADTTSTRTTKTATTQSPTPPEFHDAEFKRVDASMRSWLDCTLYDCVRCVCVPRWTIVRRFALTAGKCFVYYLFENITSKQLSNRDDHFIDFINKFFIFIFLA